MKLIFSGQLKRGLVNCKIDLKDSLRVMQGIVRRSRISIIVI